MFDFTSEIKLNKYWEKRYRVSQAVLYSAFFLLAAYFASRILFPSYMFNYTFGATGLSNNILNPRDAKQNSLASGNFTGNSPMLFNVNQLGNFSKATLSLTLVKNSPLLGDASFVVQKSFQAFFYPTGAALGFKNGSLLKNANDYYIVSDGALRKFSSAEQWQTLGFNDSAFMTVGTTDLQYNALGEDIRNQEYPNGLIFKIKDVYYQLNNKQLQPFTSTNAFLSQYAQTQAINKDASFLTQFPLADTYLGYADGTLASIGQSVIILSNGKYYPVDSPQTFTGLGYDWNDVVPITSDELALYNRQKQFNDTNPHPDGAVFFDQDKKEYFYVSNQQKLPLKTAAIAASYLANRKPIIVDSKSLTTQSATCALEKNLWP
ncbi:MAG TPA: hypothetical protein VF817_03090, partial [Patescibacteria group bacterium]